MKSRVVTSISSIDARAWNALDESGNPLVRHEFLRTLEQTACVGPGTGWRPHHLVLEDAAGTLLAAMPLYLKMDSWGEFVFDWSWARAYAQAGLRYYPKLVSMTPFTPAEGPRLLVPRCADAAARRERLMSALIEHSQAQGVSSTHVLFVTPDDRTTFANGPWLTRKDCQFHWHNRGYESFDAFLATFRAEKRKKALRERRRIREAGIAFRTLKGEEMDERLWATVFRFSAATFEARGHEHYLNTEFFLTLARAMPGSIMVKLAEFQREPIAAAIFFQGGGTLYGRYWGAEAQYHSLHFETCYYQGIEYCIEQGIGRFNPGTQGEHKVPRGFEPTETWSVHWIADERFRRALESYLAEERRAIDEYIRQVREHVPFKASLDAEVS